MKPGDPPLMVMAYQAQVDVGATLLKLTIGNVRSHNPRVTPSMG